MQRINVDTNNMTVAELRKEVRRLTKIANSIVYETGNNTQDRFYWLGTMKNTTKGGVTSAIPVNYLNRKQSIKTITQLTNFINSDTTSSSYKDYMDKREKRTRQRFKKTMRERYGRNVTDAEFDQMVALKEMFPELFDSSEVFYKEVLAIEQIIGKKASRDSKGRYPTIMELLLQAKKQVEQEDGISTPNAIKLRMLENLNVTQEEFDKKNFKVVI